MGVVTVVVALLLGAAAVEAGRGDLHIGCSKADKYVYPYTAFCDHPAALNAKYYYVARAAFTGGMVPEYDSSNKTFYVRLTGNFVDLGHKYVATVASSDLSNDENLLLNSTVYIYNSLTERVLQWREEASGEYFLIEKATSSVSEGAPFRFIRAEGLIVPCPLIYPVPQCYAYYLVTDTPDSSSYPPNAGLLGYKENGVTYIKNAPKGSVGDIPLYITGGILEPAHLLQSVVAN